MNKLTFQEWVKRKEASNQDSTDQKVGSEESRHAEATEAEGTKTAEWYAAEINSRLRTNLNNIFAIGDLLNEAKDQLAHGELLTLYTTLGWADTTAQTYMRVGRYEPFRNDQCIGRLPEALGTLDELTRLRASDFHRLLAEGKINRELTREEAKALVKEINDANTERFTTALDQLALFMESRSPQDLYDGYLKHEWNTNLTVLAYMLTEGRLFRWQKALVYVGDVLELHEESLEEEGMITPGWSRKRPSRERTITELTRLDREAAVHYQPSQDEIRQRERVEPPPEYVGKEAPSPMQSDGAEKDRSGQ